VEEETRESLILIAFVGINCNKCRICTSN
jgi:hypothetical protein